MIDFITVEQALNVHDRLLEQHSGLHGIRDLGLLISALEMPKATMFGENLHPTLFDKSAAYLFHIVKNHPFNDGNKRTGSFIAVLFLWMNEVKIKVDQKQYEDLVLLTATSLAHKTQINAFFSQQPYSRR
jgi:death-on-curing protein